MREQEGISIPGPEPPETIRKWARVVVEVKGRKVHDTGFKDVGRHQSVPWAFDVAWAPDSAHVAYRAITTLSIVDRHGQVHHADIPCTNSLISSFKWISEKELLVVVKEVDTPLELYGYPASYHGFLAKAKRISILRVNLDGAIANRFVQHLANPAFAFHSIGFENQEISPFSSRVAFSDGTALCVYDDAHGNLTSNIPLNAPISGTWWEINNRLIINLGASPSIEQFVRVDLTSGAIEDCTATLRPLCHRKFLSPTWFQPGDDFSERTVIPWRSLHAFHGTRDEEDLKRWLPEKMPAKTSLIYHGWSYPSHSIVSEVWFLNCPSGFHPLKQAANGRTVTLMPASQAYNVVHVLHSMGIKLGGKSPAAVWQLDWMAGDNRTEVKGIIYPHADGEILRIERIARK